MNLFHSLQKYKNKTKNIEQKVSDLKYKLTQLEYQIKYSAIEKRLEKRNSINSLLIGYSFSILIYQAKNAA